MLAVLNTFLTDAYKKIGNSDNFPLPKIILNQDILTTMNLIHFGCSHELLGVAIQPIAFSSLSSSFLSFSVLVI